MTRWAFFEYVKMRYLTRTDGSLEWNNSTFPTVFLASKPTFKATNQYKFSRAQIRNCYLWDFLLRIIGFNMLLILNKWLDKQVTFMWPLTANWLTSIIVSLPFSEVNMFLKYIYYFIITLFKLYRSHKSIILVSMSKCKNYKSFFTSKPWQLFMFFFSTSVNFFHYWRLNTIHFACKGCIPSYTHTNVNTTEKISWNDKY